MTYKEDDLSGGWLIRRMTNNITQSGVSCSKTCTPSLCAPLCLGISGVQAEWLRISHGESARYVQSNQCAHPALSPWLVRSHSACTPLIPRHQGAQSDGVHVLLQLMPLWVSHPPKGAQQYVLCFTCEFRKLPDLHLQTPHLTRLSLKCLLHY